MTTLIIGATSGIGLATAILCYEKGERVIAVGRNVAKCKSVEGVTFVTGDISSETGRSELLGKIAAEQIVKVVHCAGIFSANDNSPEYRKDYRDAKIGGFLMIEKIIRNHLITHVCVVSSLYTLIDGSFVPELEKRINTELEQLTLGLPAGIVTNCVAPGLVRTPLTEKAFGDVGMKKIMELAPGSRILEPIEIANEIHELINQRKLKVDRKVVPIDGNFLKCLKNVP